MQIVLNREKHIKEKPKTHLQKKLSAEVMLTTKSL